MTPQPPSRTEDSKTPRTLGLQALLLAGALTLGLPGTSPAQFTDNFNDGNDDEWTRYDPISQGGPPAQNQWTFPSGRYRMEAAATPNPALGPGRVASLRQDAVLASFYITVDLVDWNDTYTQAIGVLARTQPSPSLGTTAGYVFGYVTKPGFVQISRITGERTFSIEGSLPLPLVLDPAQDYRIIFFGEGTQMEGRIYLLSDLSTPLATVTASHSVYSSGTAGLLCFSLNNAVPEAVDVTFDNYYALDVVPPQVTLTDLFFGSIRLSWPISATGFKLQYASALPATTWTNVPEVEIFEDPMTGTLFYQPPDTSTGNRFYRLARP